MSCETLLSYLFDLWELDLPVSCSQVLPSSFRQWSPKKSTWLIILKSKHDSLFFLSCWCICHGFLITVCLQVLNGAILQQVFVVEFVVQYQMCDDCHRVEAKDFWKAVVQVRQKVRMLARTFFYLIIVWLSWTLLTWLNYQMFLLIFCYTCVLL